MNTKILPNQIRSLLNQPKRMVYLLGLVVVVALGAVLFLTVLRVQNQEPTISFPRAEACQQPPGCCGSAAGCSWPDRGWCTADQCGKVDWSTQGCSGTGLRCFADCPAGSTFVGGSAQGCSKDGAACTIRCKDDETGQTLGVNGACGGTPSGCRCGALRDAYCTSGGGGGTTNQCGAPDKDIACANDCVNNIRKGNCSYCRACCAAGNCSATNSGGGTVTVFVKNVDGSNYAQAGTVRMSGTSACTSCNANCADPVCNPNREKSYSSGAGSVTWSDSTTGASYDFVFVGGAGGGCSATSGGNCTIVVGGGAASGVNLQVTSFTIEPNGPASGTVATEVVVKNVGTQVATDFKVAIDKKNPAGVMNCTGKGERSVEVSVTGGLAVGATKTLDIDMPTPAGPGNFSAAVMVDSTCLFNEGDETDNIKVTPYTTGGSGGSSSCVDSQCPTGQSCFSGSCKVFHLGCTSSNVCAKLEGAGSNVNGCLAVGQVCGGEIESCWGNEGTNGRCVDCNGDGVINILDFSCFACNWSEKFTPDQNPSCKLKSTN